MERKDKKKRNKNTKRKVGVDHLEASLDFLLCTFLLEVASREPHLLVLHCLSKFLTWLLSRVKNFLRKKDKKRLSKKFLRKRSGKRLSQIFLWQDNSFVVINFPNYFVELLNTTKIILSHFSSKICEKIIFNY